MRRRRKRGPDLPFPPRSSVGGCCDHAGMQRSSDTLVEAALALAALVTEHDVSGSGSLAEVVAGLTEADLLEGSSRVGVLRNLIDAVGARFGGEIAVRSASGLGEPLAKRLGEKSAPALIAATSNVPLARAAAWCGVGEALASRRSLTGEELPCPHPLVAEALDAGRLCLEGARTILDALTHIARFASADEVADAERFLVEQAALVPVASLRPLARTLIDRFDQDGVEPREEALRQKA